MKTSILLPILAPVAAVAAVYVHRSEQNLSPEAFEAFALKANATKVSLDYAANKVLLQTADSAMVQDVDDTDDEPKRGPRNANPTLWSKTSKYAPSTQYVFAISWILMLACLPAVVPLTNKMYPTRSQLIVGAIMVIVLFGGLYLFTNIILFQSVHFKKIRPLTIIECMYFMSQVITTVGYGDITPAKERGQVFVGLYVLGAMFVISMVVSDVVNQVIESAERYKRRIRNKQTVEQQEKEEAEGGGAARSMVQQGSKINTRKFQFGQTGQEEVASGTIEEMLALSEVKSPQVSGLIGSLIAFAVIDVMWIGFFSMHPDEGKTVFQALYMSVITLSSVGFGWFTPVSEEGMIFGAYFMIFGCAALVNVITQFTELMVKLNEYEKFNLDFNREEAWTLLQTVAHEDEKAQETKISQLQFMKFCLLQMKSLEPEHLEKIDETFHNFEPTNGAADVATIKKALGITPQAASA